MLAERVNRIALSPTLRIGAKAYVNLDAEPEELVKAIQMASRDKVYLAPDAAAFIKAIDQAEG